MSSAWCRVKPLGIRFLAALVVVFLLFAPYIANLMKYTTRRIYLWQHKDTALFLASMVIIALACLLISELLRWLKRPLLTRAFNHLFIAALGAGLINNIVFYGAKLDWCPIDFSGTELETCWVILALVVGYSFGRRNSTLLLRSQQFCQILSPVLIIVAFQLCNKATYPPAMDLLPPPTSATSVSSTAETTKPCPVYLFVFDEWSYERSYANAALQPFFPNLAKFSQQATVFHDAHSPGRRTKLSMPGLLFQTNLPVSIQDRQFGFEQAGRLVPYRKFESIFSVVDNTKYQTIMLGFAQNYNQWLGNQVQRCRHYPFFAKSTNMWQQMGLYAWAAFEQWTDPWSHFLRQQFSVKIYAPYYLKLNQNLQRDVSYIIDRPPQNIFAVMHYLLPHKPFIFNDDATYRGATAEIYANSVENYNSHLACLDRHIGEFLALMKEAGSFDDALIIMTSDHSWRADPNRWATPESAANIHVPLIVKLPGQKAHLAIDSRFETYNLGRLIEWALQTEGDPNAFEKFVAPATADNPIPPLPAGLASK